MEPEVAPFQQLYVSCPDGLHVNYLTEAMAGKKILFKHFTFIHSLWWPTNRRAGNKKTQSALIVANGTPRACCICALLLTVFRRASCALIIGHEELYGNLIDVAANDAI